jgi:hypothetical protein
MKNPPPFSPPSVSLAALVAILSAGTPASAAEIFLPQETARFAVSPLPGSSLATTLCVTCHSADYVQSQPPRLPRTYWAATVIKMQKVFGAPIPADAVEPLVDFLAKSYGAERDSAPSAAVPPPAQSAPAGQKPG